MAAGGGHIQRLRDEVTCSICLDFFKDPVIIQCGHNFCRSCLIRYWGESEAEASCPQCRQRVQRRSLISNLQLANMVEIAKNPILQEGKKEGGGKGRVGVEEDFKGPICSCPQKDVQKNPQRANVTLDPDTVNPCLILSEDRKSVRRGQKQDLPDNPERFSSCLCVLGREGFTAGRHFWEVNVGENGRGSALGVARKSVRRKGNLSILPENGIWAVGIWGNDRHMGKCVGKYLACTSPKYSPLSLNPPRRIRVTLDYEGRRVSFSDADSGAELYTFSGASFSGETLLPFFTVRGFNQISIF